MRIDLAICEALDLDPNSVTKITLQFEASQPATVHVEMLVIDADAGTKIQKVIRQYRLVDKEESK